jgi:tetratricopeptide (TPR) repeat protein
LARYYYLKALAVDPRFVAALYNFAYINRYTYPRTAIAYFRKVLAIEPNDAAALYLLGRVLERNGDAALGRADIAHALALDPSITGTTSTTTPPASNGAGATANGGTS